MGDSSFYTNNSFSGTGINNSRDSTNNEYTMENIDLSSQCVFEQPPLTDVRFWIVTVFGTTVSLVSIVENSFFFFLFSTRKHHRTTYNMYMMFLTFFDIFVSGAYVLLMSINVLSDYLQSPFLVRFWFQYMVPILTVSHCGITSSTFLILAATFERYCLSDKLQWVQCVQRHRKYIILIVILVGVLSKGTIWFEFKITHVEECTSTMMEFQLQFQDFVYGTSYHTIWRFWYRNFVTVFFPFFALLALNIRIVRTLAFAERQGLSFSNTNSKQFKRKKVARSATRATVLVVFTYLFSNIINVILTTWEHIDKTLLVTDYVRAYAIALDLASLLTNLASAFRPPIYLICQPTLRQEVFAILKQRFFNKKKKLTPYNTHTVRDILYSQVDNAKDTTLFKTLSKDNLSIMHLQNNSSRKESILDMDLLRDEADFLEDKIKPYIIYESNLEVMAAEMCKKKKITTNNRLALIALPSSLNDGSYLTPTVNINKKNNCLNQNSSTQNVIIKNDKYNVVFKTNFDDKVNKESVTETSDSHNTIDQSDSNNKILQSDLIANAHEVGVVGNNFIIMSLSASLPMPLNTEKTISPVETTTRHTKFITLNAQIDAVKNYIFKKNNKETLL